MTTCFPKGKVFSHFTLTWKRAAIYTTDVQEFFIIHSRAPFSSSSGSLESYFPACFWSVAFFLHDWGLLDIFLTHHSSTLGLSQVAGSFLCLEFTFLGLLCVFSLMWEAINFIILDWEIIFFGMISGWVSSPTILLHFLVVFPRWKFFW